MKNRIEIFCCVNSNSVNYFYGQSSSGRTRVTKISTFDCKHEDELFQHFLESENTSNYSLICYNDICTTLTPGQIMNFIENIISMDNMEIFYLYKYCDSSYINTEVCRMSNYVITKVISPHGLECLLISPSCKEKLKKVIRQDNGLGLNFALNAYCEKLNAFSSFPNLVKYNSDFVACENPKCKKCTNETKRKKFKERQYRDISVIEPNRHCRNEGLMNIIWFITMMIFFIYAFYFLFKDIEDVDKEVTELDLLIKKVFT